MRLSAAACSENAYGASRAPGARLSDSCGRRNLLRLAGNRAAADVGYSESLHRHLSGMSPVIITLIAVFVGTAALCAGVGFFVSARFHDPLERLARLNRRGQPVDNSSRILKKEL